MIHAATRDFYFAALAPLRATAHALVYRLYTQAKACPFCTYTPLLLTDFHISRKREKWAYAAHTAEAARRSMINASAHLRHSTQ